MWGLNVEKDSVGFQPIFLKALPLQCFLRWGRGIVRHFSRLHLFSSLARRIVFLNLAGLLALVIAILYLNQFRAGLSEARIESLRIQGEIIAAAISASASLEVNGITLDPERLLQLQAGESIFPNLGNEELEFPINPERVAPILQRLISPTKTRARLYDAEGVLLLDSRYLYTPESILRFDLPPLASESKFEPMRLWRRIKLWFFSDLPLYEEGDAQGGRFYPEVKTALSGIAAHVVRISQEGQIIISVAVPIQRSRAVLGSLLLSTEGGDIDAILNAERAGIMRVFLVASVVMALLSVLLAGTIAGPMHRLAAAADRVRKSVKAREEIPEFPGRSDEIGHLARALRDMTQALYQRIESIERFAADVAHEVKNPLTSLRSAVETLPLAKTETAQARLLQIIQHDICRLDRLITDIADASRLDAELARSEMTLVDLQDLIETVVCTQQRLYPAGPHLRFSFPDSENPYSYSVMGHESRLAQLLTNLIENACSFSKKHDTVSVFLSREKNTLVIRVEDEGPGILAPDISRIFERFYTDRPPGEEFGNHSGLGLSISKQIVESHQGSLTAENLMSESIETQPSSCRGACFTVRLPGVPL